MDIYVVNKSLELLTFVENFESFIWTERYDASGEFELITRNVVQYLPFLKPGNYLIHNESKRIMAITTAEMSNDEDGDVLKVTGSSVEEYILNKRIVWSQTSVTGSPDACISKLLNENLISPSDTKRKIPGISYKNSTDANINKIKVTSQYTGDKLYKAVLDICIAAEIGLDMRQNETGDGLVLSVFKGADRSLEQSELPFVLFSPMLENISSSEYAISHVKYANVAAVYGEGEGSARKSVVVGETDVSGLDRSEMYVDARDIRSKNSDDSVIPADVYLKHLRQRGDKKLAEVSSYEAFDAEISPYNMYVYGVDYYLGDLVQIENAYRMTKKVRVSEYIWSVDSEGSKNYPTLVAI